MNLINEMSLSFPSKSSNEAFARSAVSAFVIGLDPTVAELSDIKTAVSEAVTNCIVHGYRRESGTVYINGKIYENNKVVIKIRDKGCGIADIEKAMEPLYHRSRRRQSRSWLCGYAELLRQSKSQIHCRQRHCRYA